MSKYTPEQIEKIKKLVQDDEAFSAHCLKVLDKRGNLVPFIWNRAQKYIHERLEQQLKEKGYVRALILKGRQQGCCLDPDTRVLTSDLRWVRIGDVKPGVELVAVDEETSSVAPGLKGGGRGRKMRTSVVEVVVHTRQPSYRITLDDGRQLITSGKHRWLIRKSQTQWTWRSVDGLAADGRDAIKVGDKMRSVTSPWGDSSLDDAWFGGMIDGEGSMDQSPSRTGIRLAVSQRAGAVLDRMEAHCTSRGWGHYIVSDDGPRKTKHGRDAVHAVNLSNIGKMFEVIGRCRPVRFVGRRWWEGKSMPDNGERVIVSIESLGERDVVDIQTSTGTFLAEGIVSHNSTYIAARFYRKTSTKKGRRAFIVSHEEKSTQNLFAMVKRYDDHNPLAPSKKASNAQELIFGRLDSGYKLATAGSQDVGRGNTAQLLHGSEFGFWANAQAHLAGIGNSIPLEAGNGSEIILESTANGLGNAYHQMWQEAEAGRGEYIAIFVPWYWQDEYRLPTPDGFELSDEDQRYMLAYGLDMDQMAWRAAKIAEYGKGFAWLFDQEYPATAAIAFQTATQNPLINPTDVMEAVNSQFKERQGALLIGCDPAEEGMDRTAIVFRQGRTVFRIEYHEKKRPMEVAGILAGYWNQYRPDGLFVDKGGIGAGIVDRLRELYVPVIAVNFGERATDSEIYENKRAECWWRMKEWVEDHPNRLPRDGALIADLVAPQPMTTSKNKRLLESKKDMRKRGIRSPDGGDALAITFAEPVAPMGGLLGVNEAPPPPTHVGY